MVIKAIVRISYLVNERPWGHLDIDAEKLAEKPAAQADAIVANAFRTLCSEVVKAAQKHGDISGAPVIMEAK